MKEIENKYPDKDYPKTIGELNNFWHSLQEIILGQWIIFNFDSFHNFIYY